MTRRRERAIDAVMTYWLAGVARSDEMAEWWTTRDATYAAAEIVDVILKAIDEDDT